METQNLTDHESLLLLRQEVKSVKDGQDIFHQEVRSSFKRLEDGYAKRLDTLENKVENLEYKNMWFAGALATIGIVASLVVYIYFNQQEVQNEQIQQLVSKIK